MPVKRNIAVISFLISMVIVISHDIIPHRHVDPDEMEITSNQRTDNQWHNKTKNDHKQRNHFPPHQHVFSDGDFITVRNAVSLNKILKDTHQDLGYLSFLFSDINDNTYFTGFDGVIKRPLSSYPYIIPFNSTRGSPFLS